MPKHRTPGPWSDWTWSEPHNQHYRARQRADGSYEYQFENQTEQPPPDDEPRSSGGVEEVTQDFQNLTTEEYDDNTPSEDNSEYSTGYALGGGYNAGSSTTTHPSESTSKSKSKSKSSRHKGKGKGVSSHYSDEHSRYPRSYHYDEQPSSEQAQEDVPEQPSEDPPQEGGNPPLDPFWGARRSSRSAGGYSYNQHPDDEDDNRSDPASGHSRPFGPTPYRDPDDEDEVDEQIHQHPRAEDETYVGGGHAAHLDDDEDDEFDEHRSGYAGLGRKVQFADSVPDDDEPDDDDGLERAKAESRNFQYSEAESSQHGGWNSAYGPMNPDPDEDGRETPRAGSPQADSPKKLDIRGTAGAYEALDPRYRVESSNRFQPGEVFKVLWSEPQGQVGGTPTISDKKEIRNGLGSFYVGFRRFIVIANDEGHCTCVPILTYGGKGCKKKGLKPQKHGIIYERGHRVRPLENEPKLGFLPIKMRMEVEGEKLTRESRVNYSKLVTIEHNVKVFFIGHIVNEDWDIVHDAVNKCWESKVHDRKKRPARK